MQIGADGRGIYRIARALMQGDVLNKNFKSDERVQEMMNLKPKSVERQRIPKKLFIDIN